MPQSNKLQICERHASYSLIIVRGYITWLRKRYRRNSKTKRNMTQKKRVYLQAGLIADVYLEIAFISETKVSGFLLCMADRNLEVI